MRFVYALAALVAEDIQLRCWTFTNCFMKIKPRKFYHRVSFDAVEHLKRELGHNINIQAPQTQYIPHLLGKICPRSLKVRNVPCGLLNPSAIGDQHLRLMYAAVVVFYVFAMTF